MKENVSANGICENKLLLTEVIFENNSAIIRVLQNKCSMSLTKDIHETFRSLLKVSDNIVLNISILEEIDSLFYLEVLNMAMISRTQKIKFHVENNLKTMNCDSCYLYLDKENFRCDQCFAELLELIK
jgi:hypothetical protein